MPPSDCIKLESKVIPTKDQPTEAARDIKLYIDHGAVDIGALKNRILRDELIWDKQNQTESNVRIVRAFHDEIGVDSVPFIFSDDLMQDVYVFPWWNNWKDSLEPIFQHLNISSDRVARCILARIPSGTVIPSHHDTGLWTYHTHRMHVPIQTSRQDGDEATQVVFKAGITKEELIRVPFQEGHVLELNNRAIHQVENHWHEKRIHLIFDYVDTDYKTLNYIELRKGEILHQTRRCIFRNDAPELKLINQVPDYLSLSDRKIKVSLVYDVVKELYGSNTPRYNEYYTALNTYTKRYASGELLVLDFVNKLQGIFKQLFHYVMQQISFASLIKDKERQFALSTFYKHLLNTGQKHSASIPSYLIIGCMKCGTTSMYDYINQHPKFIKAKQKEPHFFDWKWNQICNIELNPHQQSLSQFVIRKYNDETSTDPVLLKYMHCFAMQRLVQHPHEFLLTGEATPSYILGGQPLASRIHAIMPKIKIIVCLRDPVDRAFSHYQMTADTDGTDAQKRRRGNVNGLSFEQLVQQDLAALEKAGISAFSSSDEFLEKYLVHLPQGHGSHSYIGRGLYALQLEQWFKVFSREQDMKLQGVHTQLGKVWEFLGVDGCKIQDTAAKNKRKYSHPIAVEVKQKLQEYYRPHNERLQKLLSIDLSSWNT